MSTSTTRNTPAKSTPTKVENKVVEPVKDDTVPVTELMDKVAEDFQSEEKTEEEVKPRIPQTLADNSMFLEFCERYLSVLDEIAEYNKAVLAEKDSEWNATKVLSKAHSFARPTDKSTVDDAILKLVVAYEETINAQNRARKAVLDATSKKLGITLSATADRNPEIEGPLKEKRKVAVEIGSSLNMIAGMTSNTEASTAVIEFLTNNPLPSIGRDQARSFGGDDTKSTPKYRVNVTITNKDGEILHEDAGFTKASLALTKPVFGYERGKAPGADTFRTIWEKAGNSAEKTVTSPVEFDDNDLHFVITKK